MDLLTSATPIQLGLVFTILTTALAGYRWMDSRFTRLENQVRTALQDRMTRTNHRIWVLEARILNPSFKFPRFDSEDEQDHA